MEHKYIIVDGMVVPVTEAKMIHSADPSVEYQPTNTSFSTDASTVTIDIIVPSPIVSSFSEHLSSKSVVSLVRIRFEEYQFIIRSATIIKKRTTNDQTNYRSSIELALLNCDSITKESLDY